MKSKAGLYDIIVETLCIILLVGISVYLIINWSSFPDRVPGHYGANGNIDRWGAKGELLTIPLVGWILYIAITILEAYPQIWNTGVTITKENKERIYKILKNMIVTVKLLTVGMFSYISIYQTTAAALPGYFLPSSLVLLFGTIAYCSFKLVKSK